MYSDEYLKEWLLTNKLEIIESTPNKDGKITYGVFASGFYYIIASGETWQEAVIKTIKIVNQFKSTI